VGSVISSSSTSSSSTTTTTTTALTRTTQSFPHEKLRRKATLGWWGWNHKTQPLFLKKRNGK
jgi:hypothetical protein